MERIAMQEFTIGKNQAGQRLDKFLFKYLPNANASFIYKMLRKKNITLNDKKATGKELLTQNDSIKCFFSEETFAKFSGNLSATESVTQKYANEQHAYKALNSIKVLFENEHILAAYKPAEILSQKATANDISVNEWLIGYMLHHQMIKEDDLHTFRPSITNRLDRNTSGIILCGKSLSGSQYLSLIIKERQIRKFYHTICIGEIKTSQKIEGYLVKDIKKNKVHVSKTGNDNANYICTFYKPLCIKNGYTLLEVELITGKPHQIRAHLSSIGHPIIGDMKYGNMNCNKNMKELFHLNYQLLHAYKVVFPENPNILTSASGQCIIAPYPKLFSKILKEMELDGNMEF